MRKGMWLALTRAAVSTISIGSLTFITVVSRSFLASEQTRRHLVASLLVLVWTIRLGSFLVLR